MRTPSATPAERVCQFSVFFNWEVFLCGERLTGRGPRKWCPSHSKEVRKINNARHQQNYRVRDKEKILTGHRFTRSEWDVFVHRLRRNGRIGEETFLDLISPYFKYPGMKELVYSLLGYIEIEARTGAVDFNAFDEKGEFAFSFTIYGPSSLGHSAGRFYCVIHFGEAGQEVLSGIDKKYRVPAEYVIENLKVYDLGDYHRKRKKPRKLRKPTSVSFLSLFKLSKKEFGRMALSAGLGEGKSIMERDIGEQEINYDYFLWVPDPKALLAFSRANFQSSDNITYSDNITSNTTDAEEAVKL